MTVSLTKSWVITFIPLITYIFGIGLKLIGFEGSEQLDQAFQGLLYFFITSAGVGSAKAILSKKTG